MENQQRVRRIISSGESGADRTALMAAESLGLGTGGWCQRKLTPNPYNLKDITSVMASSKIMRASVDMVKRNIDDSDGTLIFRVFSSVGPNTVLGYCVSGKWRPFTEEDKKQKKTLYKPCLVISDLSDQGMGKNTEAIRDFLRVNRIRTLNITGHRDGVLPGYTQSIMNILVIALSQ